MTEKQRLEARRAEIEARLRALNTEAGAAELSDDQAEEWRKLEAEHVDVRDQITEAERRAQIEESRARWTSLQVSAPVPTDEVRDVRALSRGEVRDRSRKALENRDLTRHLESDQLDKVDRLLTARTDDLDGAVIGRALLASESDAYHGAFMKAMRDAQPAFTAEEVHAINEVRAAGLTGTSGGFGVPVLIDPSIVLTSQGTSNPVRRIARVETITTDKWKGVSSAGIEWGWFGEGAASDDDTPTLAQPEVDVFTARGFVPYSIEIGMDYPGFAAEYGVLLAEGYDELQAQAFVVGSGSTMPTGVFVEGITKISVTTDGSFGGGDIGNVWGALPERYRGNATWLMSTDVGNEVAGFGNGNNLSFVTVDLTGVVETIRTRPVAYSDYAPAFTGTTAAANLLVVGDFRNYLVADRAGMSVELIPHLFDTTNNRPTGQRGFFAWARVGGASINDNGFRILANT